MFDKRLAAQDSPEKALIVTYHEKKHLKKADDVSV